MAAQRSVVLCAPLCFAFSKVNKLSLLQIVGVLSDWFVPEDISTAKKILVEDVRRQNLDKADGKLPQLLRARRDADRSARVKKEAEDIVNILLTLDRHHLCGKLPIYATDSTDSIPTLKLEDGDMQYLWSKMGKMEDAIFNVQKIINMLYAKITEAEEAERAQRMASSPPWSRIREQDGTLCYRPGPSIVNVDGTSLPQPCSSFSFSTLQPTNSAASAINETDHQSNSTATSQPSEKTQASVTADVYTVVNDANYGSHSRWADCQPSASSAAETDGGATSKADDDNDDDNDFTVVENRRKKRRRHRRSQSSPEEQQPTAEAPLTPATPAPVSHHHPLVSKTTYASAASKKKPLIVGKLRSPTTSNNTATTVQNRTGKLSAAKPLIGKASYCVDNVHKDVSTEEVERFVKEILGVRVIKCNETRPRRTYRQVRDNVTPDHKAFHLCINKADSKLFLDADKWPADISVSAWYFKKKDDDQQSTTPAAAAGTVQPDNASAIGQSTATTQSTTTATTSAAAADTDGNNGIALDGTNGNTSVAEMMTSSPIGTDHSGEYLEPTEDMDDNDDTDELNGTSVAVVDLSNVILNN
jgi:hypothetical protein